MTLTGRQAQRAVAALVVLGAIARVAAGLPRGADAFLTDGYSFYLTISRNFLDGIGLCYSIDGGCAARMPLYPLWLAPFVAGGVVYPGVILAQAVAGSLLAWIAWDLGRRLFDDRVGLIAAAATALNPYAVIHDTALQDTVFINLLIALSILLLLRARGRANAAMWIAAGLALAAALLTNARIALFVPCAIAWVLLAFPPGGVGRWRAALLVSLPILLLAGGWAMRNWRVVGAPVLTTEAGDALWFGNNQWTFAHFPQQSIDLTEEEMRTLPPDQRDLLMPFAGTEAQRDAFVAGWAVDYITADPARTAIAAARKLWIAVSAQLSPARSPLVQFGYAAVFLPVHVLAAIALWRERARWRTHALVYLLLASFAVTTALFWAHTSHKSYLDAMLFIYAAAALCAWLPERAWRIGAPV